MEGHCLCGAVRVSVGDHDPAVTTCHCSMCRRWNGLAMPGFDAEPDQVTVTGPVVRYRSSSFAERAFCGTCGTHLWIRDDGKQYELMPGLFDAARDFPLAGEVYADRAFASARFAGDHPRGSAAEYEATRPHVEGRP